MTTDCEICGHAYAEGYGSMVEMATGAKWICHPCQRERLRRRIKNRPDWGDPRSDPIADVIDHIDLARLGEPDPG